MSILKCTTVYLISLFTVSSLLRCTNISHSYVFLELDNISDLDHCIDLMAECLWLSRLRLVTSDQWPEPVLTRPNMVSGDQRPLIGQQPQYWPLIGQWAAVLGHIWQPLTQSLYRDLMLTVRWQSILIETNKHWVGYGMYNLVAHKYEVQGLIYSLLCIYSMEKCTLPKSWNWVFTE